MSTISFDGMISKIREWERKMDARGPVAVEFLGSRGTLARLEREPEFLHQTAASPLDFTGVRLRQDESVPAGCLDCIDRHGKAFKRLVVYRIMGAMPEGEG